MTETIATDPKRRHDFVLLFDVSDGNPNGDPDAGNQPRTDPETMQGLVTDVAMKRKVRDYVASRYGGQDGSLIYIQSGVALNDQHAKAYTALGLTSKSTKQASDDVNRARDWMCKQFFDIRMFGAVMTTGVNCGQVRGPVQLTFARSIDPVIALDVTITRVTVTRPEDMKVEVGDDGKAKGKQTEMGSKAIVPYGLYRAHGFFNPHFATQTGVSAEDLDRFWNALILMWDLDRSATRGEMACRGLHVFSHESSYGNAPAHTLFDRFQVALRDGVRTPRSFGDYEVRWDGEKLPEGVTLTSLVG